MTRLVVRLVLAMLILPITGVLFVVLFIAIVIPAPGLSGEARIIAMWAILYTFVGAYWTLLWRDIVRWTARRIALTALAAPAALGVGLVGAMLFIALDGQRATDEAVLMGGTLVPIAWVIVTVMVWRETPRERMERLAAAGRGALCCPLCGYNMTGLREARCPECGTAYTLDELMAAQPAKDHADLADE